MGAVERVHITQVYTNCPESPSGGSKVFTIHTVTYTITPLKQHPLKQGNPQKTGSVQDRPAAPTLFH